MFTAQPFSFTGTATDIVDNGVKLNGKFLDKVTVGALANHGLIEAAGEGSKPRRGRTPRLFKLESRPGLEFSCSNFAVTAAGRNAVPATASAVTVEFQDDAGDTGMQDVVDSSTDADDHTNNSMDVETFRSTI